MQLLRTDLAEARAKLAVATDPKAKAGLEGVILALEWAIEDGGRAPPSEVAAGWRQEPVIHPLDHDANGEKGGDLPDSPPALGRLNKAELQALAEAEGVEVADDATNAELREAIEAARG